MPAVYVPIGTVANTGWTVVPSGSAHEVVDETVFAADDELSYLSATASASCELQLPAVQDPGSITGRKVRVRARTVGGTQNSTLTVQLVSTPGGGPPLLQALYLHAPFHPEAAWTVHEWEVPDENGLLDYPGMRIKLLATIVGGEEIQVTSAEFETPEAVDIRLTRIGGEVLAAAPAPDIRLTRAAIEVIAKPPGAVLRATRIGMEVIGKMLPVVRVTRSAIEVLAAAPPPGIRLSRIGFEVLGRNIYDSAVFPGVLPDPLPNFFGHNWIQGVELESAYLTDISAADSVSEERRGLVDRPYRTLRMRASGLDRDEAGRLWMNLRRFAQGPLVAPLFCDPTKTTSATSSLVIPCDTTERRFANGCRVVIHTWDSNNRPKDPFYALATTIQPGQINLSTQTPLPITYPAGSRVYPVIDCEIVLDGSGIFPAREVFGVELELIERVGKSALFAAGEELPDGTPLASDGRPIFDLVLDWARGVDVGVVRAGEQFGAGRGRYTNVRGDRAQPIAKLRMLSITRSQAWKWLRWHDVCRGRVESFYLVEPGTLFEAVAVTSTSLEIKPFGNYEDLELFVDHIALVKRDGSYVVVPVTGTVNNADVTWTIQFASIGAIALADIRRATAAHLGRFGNDARRERWQTDQVCELALDFVGLLEEKSVALSNLDDLVVTTEVLSSIPNLFFWWEAGINCWEETYPAVQPSGRLAFATDHGQGIGLVDDVRAGSPYSVDTWADSNVQSEHTGALVYFGSPETNNGRPAVQATDSNQGLTLQGDSTYFSNSLGLTYAICLRTRSSPATDDRFLDQNGILSWRETEVRMFSTADVVDTDNWITDLPNLHTGELMTLVFTWKPGDYARVYKNGIEIGTAPVSVVTGLAIDPSRIVRLWSIDGGGNQGFGDSALDFYPFTNGSALFARALSISELNTLGTYWKQRYGAPWTVIV